MRSLFFLAALFSVAQVTHFASAQEKKSSSIDGKWTVVSAKGRGVVEGNVFGKQWEFKEGKFSTDGAAFASVKPIEGGALGAEAMQATTEYQLDEEGKLPAIDILIRVSVSKESFANLAELSDDDELDTSVVLAFPVGTTVRFKGVYLLKDDTLRICLNPVPENGTLLYDLSAKKMREEPALLGFQVARPTKLSASAREGTALIVLKRVTE